MAIAEHPRTAENADTPDEESAKDMLLHAVFGSEASAMGKAREELSLNDARIAAILDMTQEAVAAIMNEVGYYSRYMSNAQFATFVADEAVRMRESGNRSATA